MSAKEHISENSEKEILDDFLLNDQKVISSELHKTELMPVSQKALSQSFTDLRHEF